MDNNNDKYRVEDRREDEPKTKTKTNWWPLLLVPVAFVLGWGAGDSSDNNQRTAETTRTEYGVGGGPGEVPSPSPMIDSAAD